jgi:hypothetical protein
MSTDTRLSPMTRARYLARIVPGRWLVLDMLPITLVDASGLYTTEEVADAMRERGVVLAAAARQTEWRLWAESRGRAHSDRKIAFYPTFGEVIRAYQSMQALGSGSP